MNHHEHERPGARKPRSTKAPERESPGARKPRSANGPGHEGPGPKALAAQARGAPRREASQASTDQLPGPHSATEAISEPQM